MSKNNEENIDLIKSVFESVRTKKLKKTMNYKTAMIEITRHFVWMDTYKTSSKEDVLIDTERMISINELIIYSK